MRLRYSVQKPLKTITMNKYKQNLRIDGSHVISYTTHVATIDHESREVRQLGYWSTTTQKHINYVARELGYKLIK